ncbi:MAG: DUF2846 domain-containing protein [bacterium]|nr:DUF2846 domain-containing protein [bacterium]
MKPIFVAVIALLAMLAGCASVPLAPPSNSAQAKQFNAPSPDKAGVYIYRIDSFAGAGLKKDVWIDQDCVGETAKGVFFYQEVDGDLPHSIATESEFSPNRIVINPKKGRLYFVEQYIKLGVFVGGADLREQDVAVGQEEVSKLKLAVPGHCSSS